MLAYFWLKVLLQNVFEFHVRFYDLVPIQVASET